MEHPCQTIYAYLSGMSHVFLLLFASASAEISSRKLAMSCLILKQDRELNWIAEPEHITKL